MKIELIFLLSLLVVIGCNLDKSNDSSSEASRTSDSTEIAEQTNQKLANLTKKAQNQESKLEFAEAAETWLQICQEVSQRFGDNSWQLRNAMLAYEGAVQRARFNTEQIESWQQITDLNNQIKSALKEGDLKSALKLSQRVLKLRTKLYGDESIQVGQSLIQLATIQSRLNQVQNGVRNYHAGVRLLKHYGFADHPELELAHAGLAALYSQQEKYAPAAANQKEAARIAGAIWGQNSPNFAVQANQLGVIYHRAGNLTVAEEILRRTRQIRESALGADHEAFAQSCVNLGIVFMDKQDIPAASEQLELALQVLRDHDVASDPIALQCKSQLATIYMLQKRPRLAEPLLDDIVRSLEKSANVDTENLLSHQYRLAIALSRQGKYELARPLLESLLPHQIERFGESDPKTIASMRAYALLLERTDHPQSAVEVRNQIDRVAQLQQTNDFKTSN